MIKKRIIIDVAISSVVILLLVVKGNLEIITFNYNISILIFTLLLYGCHENLKGQTNKYYR